MDYFSDSFRAQRLELIGKSTMINSALDQLAARPAEAFEGMHFFFGNKQVFSQWHPATFSLGGHDYTCTEQYMMHHKALLFGDIDIAQQVLATADPKTHKALGRRVTPFDADEWREHCRRIVYEANVGKFMQNRPLRDALLATGDALLVEAAPRDLTWGIGYGAANPKAQDRSKWRGKNWLGYVLTLLREDVAAFAKTT